MSVLTVRVDDLTDRVYCELCAAGENDHGCFVQVEKNYHACFVQQRKMTMCVCAGGEKWPCVFCAGGEN